MKKSSDQKNQFFTAITNLQSVSQTDDPSSKYVQMSNTIDHHMYADTRARMRVGYCVREQWAAGISLFVRASIYFIESIDPAY